MHANSLIDKVMGLLALVMPQLFAQLQTTSGSKVDPAYYISFIAKPSDLAAYYHRTDVLLIASSGRSGSTLLSQAVSQYRTIFSQNGSF